MRGVCDTVPLRKKEIKRMKVKNRDIRLTPTTVRKGKFNKRKRHSEKKYINRRMRE